MFIVVAELVLSPNAKLGIFSTTYALLVRFLFMPAFSLQFVRAMARRGWYVDDKLVYTPIQLRSLTSLQLNVARRFGLIQIPSGPSAMLLANVAELVNVDQGPIATYLTTLVCTSCFPPTIRPDLRPVHDFSADGQYAPLSS